MKKNRSSTPSKAVNPPRNKKTGGSTKPKKATSSKSPPSKAAPLKKAALKKALPQKPTGRSASASSGKTSSSKTTNNKNSTENREIVMAKRVIKALEDLKGKNIVSLDVKQLTDVMDIMIIVSGTSNRHVKSLADHAMMEMKKAGYRHYGLEGEDAGEWVLVDFGGVVLHVMQPHIREFYDLERLWSTPQAAGE